jgi:Periplasmic lysozyme inhibitor of I-type lysozyme
MKQLATVLAALLAATTLHAAAPDRFVQKVRLSSELIAVVAEGDFEARSIGSFSVRLYSSRNALPGDDTTFLIAGSIRERGGFIERFELADVDADGQGEIIVIVRAARLLNRDGISEMTRLFFQYTDGTELVCNSGVPLVRAASALQGVSGGWNDAGLHSPK